MSKLLGLLFVGLFVFPAVLRAQGSDPQFYRIDSPHCNNICSKPSMRNQCVAECNTIRQDVTVKPEQPPVGDPEAEFWMNQGKEENDSPQAGFFAPPAKSRPAWCPPAVATEVCVNNPSMLGRNPDGSMIQQSQIDTNGKANEARQQRIQAQYNECLEKINDSAICSANWSACHDNPNCQTLTYQEPNKDSLDSAATKPPGLTPEQQEAEAAMKSCVSGHRNAQITCNGQQYAPVLAGILQTFMNRKNTGDIKAACQSAGKAAAVSASMQGVFAFQCKRSADSCAKTCAQARRAPSFAKLDEAERLDYIEKQRTCEGFTGVWMQGLAQGLKDMGTFAESKNCVAAAEAFGACSGDKAYDNPSCPQYCLSPKHMREDVCSTDLCKIPANQNTLTCYCASNPTDTAKCGGVTNGIPTNTVKNNLGTVPGSRAMIGTTPGFDLGDDNGDEQEFQGGPSAPVKAAGVNYEGNGGGGVGGSGGLGSGSMGGGGRGKQEGPYDTSILRGYGSSGGGGSTYGGGGGYGSLGSNNNNGYGKEKDNGFDPRKYMPKMGDSKRGPASISAELYNNGITAANGLSNFEKVTKKMNEKRSHLLP